MTDDWKSYVAPDGTLVTASVAMRGFRPAEAGSEFAEMAPYPCRTLRLLAQPYAGHGGFKEEWRA